jgi:hypothetical protein
MPFPSDIISGGQTGADRAALDAAIRHGFPHSGWCPKGRIAEDGTIGAQYNLKETPTASYLQRTQWNVRDSEGTAILTLSPDLEGGCKQTAEFAEKLGRPWIHIIRSRQIEPAEEHKIARLNIAGSRESREPGIYLWVYQVIDDAFFRGVRNRDEG